MRLPKTRAARWLVRSLYFPVFLQTPISGLSEIGAPMCASRINPTCVDRSSPWRSRISGAPLRAAPRPGHTRSNPQQPSRVAAGDGGDGRGVETVRGRDVADWIVVGHVEGIICSHDDVVGAV